jgi:phosphatidylethanolamine/phosphatidyl-N-methylethanolamine N-methyltransferase
MNHSMTASRRNAAYAIPSPPRKRVQAVASQLGERLAFLGAFLRKPHVVGAITPSSQFLAHAMIEGMELNRAKLVVELGPGTGAFSKVILERLGRHTEFLALELDMGSAKRLRQQFPGVAFHHDSAENLQQYVARSRSKRADIVISGLPWTILPRPLHDRIFRGIIDSLAPDGLFATFAYVHGRCLPSAGRFRSLLKDHFQQVNRSHVVWRNIPPAFVYRCSRPIPNRPVLG